MSAVELAVDRLNSNSGWVGTTPGANRATTAVIAAGSNSTAHPQADCGTKVRMAYLRS